MPRGQDHSFDHDDRQAIYEYVDRHGTVSADDVRAALGIGERGFRHHVAILQRDGYLESVGGDLRIALEGGEVEEFRDDDLAFAIRPAREADLTGLVGVIREVAAEGHYIEAETVADVIDHEDVLLRHDEIESRMFFVATVDDDVVGWVDVHGPELDKLAHTARLTVGVLDAYRGHGIGSQLLQRGLGWAAANGYEKLYNSAPATNERAIEFLQGQGWETEAVREDHYRIDGEYVDEVMMAVRL